MDFNKYTPPYSMKNIPTPNENSYLKQLIHKTELFLRRIRWKVFYFDKDNTEDDIERNTFGFNTNNSPPPNKDLVDFENELYDIIPHIRFNKPSSSFQHYLTNEAKKINKSKHIFIPADKTKNLYEMNTDTYEKLLKENITRHYKKVNKNVKASIDKQAEVIATKLELADRIECIAKKDAFITLKDHKENFNSKPTCRLINPAKTEIGKISKQYLQDINTRIRDKINLQQWRNTQTVINWFQNIPHKKSFKFLQLDIEDFYASITEQLLNKAIEFANSHTFISADTIKTIYNARQSILFNKDTTWTKKDGLFDVTMGAFDGAEICELVGLYLINEMNNQLPQLNFGLYRDDGLAVYKTTSGPNTERMKKKIIKLFKDNELNITITTNLSEVNFLDITLNLYSNNFKPYRKPNSTPLYINRDSNHPPSITKQIPAMIEKRLSTLASSEYIFNETKKDYETALKQSGHNCKLNYKEKNKKKTPRKRNIIWYNPPYNNTINVNIGKRFLDLIDKHFPPNHRLHKIINRNNVKISYSTMANMKTIISNHNKKILNNKTEKQDALCNCRNKNNCPLQEHCLQEALVYKATITTDKNEKVYLGSTETSFKTRFNNHKCSMKHEEKANQTRLSTHYWEKINLNKKPSITWSIVKKCSRYNCGSRKCDLCLSEKLEILKQSTTTKNILNKRSELMSMCRHSTKFKLKNASKPQK